MLTLRVEHNYIFFNIQEFTITTCLSPVCGPSQPDDGPHIEPKHVVVVNSCILKTNIVVFHFLAVQMIFICVYITNCLHFFTMFLSF